MGRGNPKKREQKEKNKKRKEREKKIRERGEQKKPLKKGGKNSLGMGSSQSSSLWRFDDSPPCLPQKGQEARTSLDSHC